MDYPSKADLLKEFHGDLARRYKRHAAEVENLWRSFGRGERATCLRAGIIDGAVLKHASDPSLGVVCKITPEWNLRDITEPGSDFVLDLLKHRATTSPFEQYCAGVNGGKGDHAFIEEMVRTRGLRHVKPFKDCYTWFLDDSRYGQTFQLLADHDRILATFEPLISRSLIIPQSIGVWVVERQVYMIQLLNVLIEDILDQGSQTRIRQVPQMKPAEVAVAAFSKLTIRKSSPKLALADLVSTAHDQKDSLQEYLGLLSTETVVLHHAVRSLFYSRPELVLDELGRQLPVHTDRYNSPSFFDVIQNAVEEVAIWQYLTSLLEHLKTSTADKAYRSLVVQEIANICQLELSRAQALFKRHIQIWLGHKWFKRISNAYDSIGNARVTMKGNPETLTRTDPQLHYVLRLCQPKLEVTNATMWIQKLSELHEAHPMERDKLCHDEIDSLANMAVIVGFIRDLSSVIAMPSFATNKGQTFISRFQEMQNKLNDIKGQLDVTDFVVPIDNLLVPGMAEDALETLNAFIHEKTGNQIALLYQAVVEDSLSSLEDQYKQVKAKLEQSLESRPPLPPAVPTQQPAETRVKERKQKEKTRPSRSSTYQNVETVDSDRADGPAPPVQTFKVDMSTAEVFARLFGKSQARSPLSWGSFEAAMSKLGFSVLPKYGSVYTFDPPDNMAVKRPFTTHRPHASRIEGYRTLILARRLRSMYGWDEQTFQVV